MKYKTCERCVGNKNSEGVCDHCLELEKQGKPHMFPLNAAAAVLDGSSDDQIDFINGICC